MAAVEKVLISFILLIALGCLAGGCDAALETGYEPKRLNANDSQRRAFYAPEFSPDSHPQNDQGPAPSPMQR